MSAVCVLLVVSEEVFNSFSIKYIFIIKLYYFYKIILN